MFPRVVLLHLALLVKTTVQQDAAGFEAVAFLNDGNFTVDSNGIADSLVQETNFTNEIDNIVENEEPNFANDAVNVAELFIPRLALRRFVDLKKWNHIYTTSSMECLRLVNTDSEFKYENTSGGYLSILADGVANLPLYRVFNNVSKSFNYVLEKDSNNLTAQGWVNEGVMGYCSDTQQDGMISLNRYYHNGIFDNIIVHTEEERNRLDMDKKFGYNFVSFICYAYAEDNQNNTEYDPKPRRINAKGTIEGILTDTTTTTTPTTTTTKTTTTTRPTPKPVVVPPAPKPIIVVPQPHKPAPLPHVAIHRLYNGKGHLYTTDANELQHIKATSKTWKQESDSGYVVRSPEGVANFAIYRLYLAATDDHIYTPEAEKNALVKVGWKFESILGYCSSTKQPGMSAFHRLYNPGTKQHFMTNSDGEANTVRGNPKVYGYNYEFILCYVYNS